jgi:hypothetical protein
MRIRSAATLVKKRATIPRIVASPPIASKKVCALKRAMLAARPAQAAGFSSLLKLGGSVHAPTIEA